MLNILSSLIYKDTLQCGVLRKVYKFVLFNDLIVHGEIHKCIQIQIFLAFSTYANSDGRQDKRTGEFPFNLGEFYELHMK